MTEAVREINEHLWAAALSSVGPVKAAWPEVAQEPKPDATTDVSVALVTALVEHIVDGEPFCDHSVGICQCATIGTLRELKLWLDYKETCRKCGGEGSYFSQDKLDAAIDEFRSRYRVGDFEDYFGDGESAGTKECEECDGKGVTEI
jgi:hypothetical protein